MAAQDELRQVNEEHRRRLDALDQEFALRRSQLIQQVEPLIGVVTDKISLVEYVTAWHCMTQRRAEQSEFITLIDAIIADYDLETEPQFRPFTAGGRW